KEIVDATGEGQLKEYIGTGPFKFVEHRPDRHIKLARFDGYAARSEAASGLAGQRVAHVDELLFLPVPDYATRQAGITPGEYEHHYKPALVAKSQLEEVGFKIDLQVSDWATVVQRRNKPELWDAFSTAFVFQPEPTVSAQVLCEWPGWWCNPDKEALLQAMGREFDTKKRVA